MGELNAEILEKIDALSEQVRAQLVPQGTLAVTVQQAATILGCGRTQVFKLLKQRKLTPAPKVGRKRMVTRASVDQLQQGPSHKLHRTAPARAPVAPRTVQTFRGSLSPSRPIQQSPQELAAAVRALVI